MTGSVKHVNTVVTFGEVARNLGALLFGSFSGSGNLSGSEFNGPGSRYFTDPIINLVPNAQDAVKKLICKAPTIGGGGGYDAYFVAGGSVNGAASLNPRNGQISLGFDTGVGLGFGGGARVSEGNFVGIGNGSSEALPIAGGGININATAIAGVGATGSYQLIGSNQGDYSIGATAGPDLSANINLSGHGQFNLPSLYSLDCK